MKKKINYEDNLLNSNNNNNYNNSKSYGVKKKLKNR